jgi:hypothetical protein
MSEEDKNVAQQNSDLISSAALFLGLVFGITMIVGFGLAYFWKIDFIEIMKLNLIILVFVGLTEFIFLHTLPKKYISSDTNFVRYTILKKLKEKFNSN